MTSSIERLAQQLQKLKDNNSLLPLFIYIIDQGLKEEREANKSEVGQLFERVHRRSPGLSRDTLAKLVKDWKAIPESIKAKTIPEPLQELERTRPTTNLEVASLVQPIIDANLREIKARESNGSQKARIRRGRLEEQLLNPYIGKIAAKDLGVRELVQNAVDLQQEKSQTLYALDKAANQIESAKQSLSSDQLNGNIEQASLSIGEALTKAQYLASASNDLTDALAVAAQAPYIDHLEPDKDQYDPKEPIYIRGRKFSKIREKNTIQILQDMPGGDVGVVKEFKPTVAGNLGTNLEIVIPNDLDAGQYYLQVNVQKGSQTLESNTIYFWVRMLPPPPPVIATGTGLSMNPQYPGREIIVNGKNFSNKCTLIFTPLDKQPITSEGYMNPSGFIESPICKLISNSEGTQLQATIPIGLWPGRYSVRVVNYLCPVNHAWSNAVEYNVLSYRYKVVFESLKALIPYGAFNISNWHPGIQDNLVALWAVVYDDRAYGKCSSSHLVDWANENIAFGSEGYVFPSEFSIDATGYVQRSLSVSTQLYDIDPHSDVSSQITTINFIADMVAGTLESLNMLSAALIVDIARKLLVEIVSWLGGDKNPPIPIGEPNHSISWSKSDLQVKTLYPSIHTHLGNITITGPLALPGIDIDFGNSKYQLDFKLICSEQ